MVMYNGDVSEEREIEKLTVKFSCSHWLIWLLVGELTAYDSGLCNTLSSIIAIFGRQVNYFQQEYIINRGRARVSYYTMSHVTAVRTLFDLWTLAVYTVARQ